LIGGEIDTAILGEPAVTGTLAVLKQNGVTNGRILCSVADLWKAVTGYDYAQASVFVKKSIDEATVAAFVEALKASIAYLNASADNAEELGTYMQERGDNSLKGAIVKQCYLRTAQNFKPAAECKDAIKKLISVLAEDTAKKDYDGIFYQSK
jgi:ABC-type nitrate/sulfonate/bicarbonate transport system substrate-binding protein